jgi:hypothetical protein
MSLRDFKDVEVQVQGQLSHIIPKEDSLKHRVSLECPCRPYRYAIDPLTHQAIWVHHRVVLVGSKKDVD